MNRVRRRHGRPPLPSPGALFPPGLSLEAMKEHLHRRRAARHAPIAIPPLDAATTETRPMDAAAATLLVLHDAAVETYARYLRRSNSLRLSDGLNPSSRAELRTFRRQATRHLRESLARLLDVGACAILARITPSAPFRQPPIPTH